MNCGSGVCTGYVKARSSCEPVNKALVASPGKTILFSPESPTDQKYSAAFTVTPGSAVLLEAYNLPVQQNIYVNRIVKSTAAFPVGDACDPCSLTGAYGVDGVIVFRERMTLGNGWKSWVLRREYDIPGLAGGTPSNAQSILQLMVVVPGTYELELEDVSMLGDLEVEYSVWPVNSMPDLPKEYFAGIVKAGV